MSIPIVQEFTQHLNLYTQAITPFFAYVFIGCMAVAGLLKLWNFVDDTPDSTSLLTNLGIGLIFTTAGVSILYIGAFVLTVVVVLFNNVPLYFWLFLIGTVVTVLSLRWIRRLHKVVNGHIKSPNAHTEKEKEEPHSKILEKQNQEYDYYELYVQECKFQHKVPECFEIFKKHVYPAYKK